MSLIRRLEVQPKPAQPDSQADMRRRLVSRIQAELSARPGLDTSNPVEMRAAIEEAFERALAEEGIVL